MQKHWAPGGVQGSCMADGSHAALHGGSPCLVLLTGSGS